MRIKDLLDKEKLTTCGVIFHCDSKEKADELLMKLDVQGYKWSGGNNLLTGSVWDRHALNSCYRVMCHNVVSLYSLTDEAMKDKEIIGYILDKDDCSVDDVNEKANRMQEITNMFGIEFGDEFELTKNGDDKFLKRHSPYKFDERGLIDKDGDVRGVLLNELLVGSVKLIKKPWKPKYGELVYYKDINGNVFSFNFDTSSTICLSRYYTGDCFKTEGQAEQFDIQFLKDFYENGGV